MLFHLLSHTFLFVCIFFLFSLSLLLLWIFGFSLFLFANSHLTTLSEKNIGLCFHSFVRIIFKLKLIWLRLSLCTNSHTHAQNGGLMSNQISCAISDSVCDFQHHHLRHRRNCSCFCVLVFLPFPFLGKSFRWDENKRQLISNTFNPFVPPTRLQTCARKLGRIWYKNDVKYSVAQNQISILLTFIPLEHVFEYDVVFLLWPPPLLCFN